MQIKYTYIARRELRLLLKGIAQAGKALFWTGVLLVAVIYISAVFCTIILGSYGLYIMIDTQTYIVLEIP